MRSALFTLMMIVVYLVVKIEVLGGDLGGYDFIIMIALFLPLFFLGEKAKDKDRREDNAERDEGFKRTVPQINADGGNPAAAAAPTSEVLFLRPFPVDTTIRVRNPALDGWATRFVPLYNFILPTTVSLDDSIRLHLQQYGELVAIGGPGTEVGAARIRVGDAQWQEYFHLLAARANMIVMFCGLQPGTFWEIEQIAQSPSLLEKTMFLLPPKGLEKVIRTEDHASLLATLKDAGLQFPPDAKEGEGYVFASDGGIRQRVVTLTAPFATLQVAKKALQDCATEIWSHRPSGLVVGGPAAAEGIEQKRWARGSGIWPAICLAAFAIAVARFFYFSEDPPWIEFPLGAEFLYSYTPVVDFGAVLALCFGCYLFAAFSWLKSVALFMVLHAAIFLNDLLFWLIVSRFFSRQEQFVDWLSTLDGGQYIRWGGYAACYAVAVVGSLGVLWPRVRSASVVIGTATLTAAVMTFVVASGDWAFEIMVPLGLLPGAVPVAVLGYLLGRERTIRRGRFPSVEYRVGQ